jgi:succinate dehydrogenase flavin-adding protein (antitoxin of CptAB toxin-antitoxin module)
MDSIEKNFADADINKDGTLDLEEFHKLLETADHYIRALPATAQGTWCHRIWMLFLHIVAN